MAVDTLTSLQSLVDAAVATGQQEIRLPAGEFHLTAPLVLKGPNHFSTFRLVGAGMVHNNDARFNGTRIIADFDGPAVVIQGGRNTTIEKLSIYGPLWPQLFGLPNHGPNLADWPGERKRYNPSCGVAVDIGPPFSGWPNLIDVEVGGFEVGVITKPDGGDNNGDFLSLTRCRILHCVYGLSITHTQSRNVRVERTTFQEMHTAVTNKDHGLQTGEIDGFFSSCDFNTLVKVCNFNQGYAGPTTFQNCYGEVVGSLGNFDSGGARAAMRTIFRDCQFHLNMAPNTLIADGGSILLDGGLYMTGDIAVSRSFTETRGAKFRPSYYEQHATYATPDRLAANTSRGLIGIPHVGNAKQLDIATTAFFPLPSSSDYQVAHDGPNGLRPYPEAWPKSEGSFADEVCVPIGWANPQPGQLLMCDVTYTVWVVQEVGPDKACSLRRVNNAGVEIPATGHFYLIRP